MSVQQSCISSTVMTSPITAGVRSFNETTLFTTEQIGPYDTQKISMIIGVEIGIRNPEIDIFPRLCLAPWFLQGQSISVSKAWGPENMINATVCESVYRIEIALHSFYTIAVISTLVLAWCLMQSLLHVKPPLSPFSEFNVVETILSASQHDNLAGIIELFARYSTIETSQIVQKWNTIRKWGSPHR